MVERSVRVAPVISPTFLDVPVVDETVLWSENPTQEST